MMASLAHHATTHCMMLIHTIIHAKAMLAKWLNACVAASFSSKDFARARKVIEQGFRNIHLFAQQTFNAYNDADPNALLLNAVFISTTNGLRGEFIGSVVRVFPF